MLSNLVHQAKATGQFYSNLKHSQSCPEPPCVLEGVCEAPSWKYYHAVMAGFQEEVEGKEDQRLIPALAQAHTSPLQTYSALQRGSISKTSHVHLRTSDKSFQALLFHQHCNNLQLQEQRSWDLKLERTIAYDLRTYNRTHLPLSEIENGFNSFREKTGCWAFQASFFSEYLYLILLKACLSESHFSVTTQSNPIDIIPLFRVQGSSREMQVLWFQPIIMGRHCPQLP